MNVIRHLSFAVLALLIFGGCKKTATVNQPPNTGLILPFYVTVNRDESSIRIEWTSTSYSTGNDVVRFKVYLNNQFIQETDTLRYCVINNINPADSYQGKVVAYIQQAGITHEVPFSVLPYTGIAVMGRRDQVLGQNVVEAYDIYTGARLWKTSTGSYNPSPFGTPVFSHDTVFITNSNAPDFLLSALNIKTGALLYKAVNNTNSTLNDLVYSNGKLYAVNGTTALALNAADGREIWRNFGSPGLGFIATPVVSGNKVYFATYTLAPNIPYKFYALDANTGAIIWGFTITSEFLRRPVIYNGIVCFSTRTNMYALREQDGTLLWQRTYDASFESSGVSVVYNNILITTGDRYHGVYGLNPSTGETIWNYRDNQRLLLPTNPVVGNGKLYVGEFGLNIYDNFLTALDPQTGTVIWQKSQQHVFTVFADNKLFSRDNFKDDILVRDANTGNYLRLIGNPDNYYNNQTSHFSLMVNGTGYYYSWHGNYQ